VKKHRLRIIAGERRGWKIEAPEGADITRPISDRIKENMFNILQGEVPGATVLDLFAGTGSIGLEALSRGARWVTFVEQHREIVELLRRNIEKLGYEGNSRVIPGSALRPRPDFVRRRLPVQVEPRGGAPAEEAPASAPANSGELVFDLIFADPPYRMVKDELTRAGIGESLARLRELGAVATDAKIVLRREADAPAPEDWPGFALVESRRYGSMVLDFLRPAPAAVGESGQV